MPSDRFQPQEFAPPSLHWEEAQQPVWRPPFEGLPPFLPLQQRSNPDTITPYIPDQAPAAQPLPRNKLDDVFVDKLLNLVLQKDGTGAVQQQLENLPVLWPRPEQNLGSDVPPPMEAIQQVYLKVAPSTVQVFSGSGLNAGMGSGFFVDAAGDVLTNAHVVENSPEGLKVRTINQDIYDAHVVKVDHVHDLALLSTRVSAAQIQPIELADYMPAPGDQVFSMGSPTKSPIGNPLGLSFAISPGFYDRVSPLRDASHGYEPIAKLNFVSKDDLQAINQMLDVPVEYGRVNIDHGSSGGPLVNANGELVGVNSNLGTDKSGKASYDEVSFRSLTDVKQFLASKDEKLAPKTAWTGGDNAEVALALLRCRPVEIGGKIAMYGGGSALLLTNLLPKVAAGIPIIGSLAKFPTFLARSGAFLGGAAAAINDGYDLSHSNNIRDVGRYGLALTADVGILAGVVVAKKYGAMPLLASIAARVGTEFIPNRQVLDD